jgi:peptidoglycan/xylan/chitin deacetylase (PgdA/CDA1 family)
MRSVRVIVDPQRGWLPWRTVPKPGQIALTFDDGPDPVNTPLVLSALEQYGLKANFFLVGQNAEKHPDLVKQIVDQGHVVGSHSFDHAHLTKLKLESAKENILKGARIVSQLSGRRSPFFRFPYGRSNSALRSFVLEQGFLRFLWDIDSYDWRNSDPEPIVQGVISSLKKKGKGIILLHDSLPVTVRSLANLVSRLDEFGQFVYFDWPSRADI